MKFESCPRCNTDWGTTHINIQGERVNYLRCEICDLNYFNDREEISLRGLLKPNYNLVWYYKKKCCCYGSLEDVVRDNILTLPWLPFTITKDRLKLLLLFS